MNTICPRCGKEDTVPFFDSKLNTHGFECHCCHQDFGVDDGKKLPALEKDILSFCYERFTKDGERKTIKIQKYGEKATLEASILHANKMLEPYEPVDFTQTHDQFMQVLFEKLYILDWKRESTGLLLGKNDESFTLELSFAIHEKIKISGTNSFPVYLKVLDSMLSFFFDQETK